MGDPEHETHLHKTIIVISHMQISGSQNLTVSFRVGRKETKSVVRYK